MSQVAARTPSELEVLALIEKSGLTEKAAAAVYFSFSDLESFVAAHDPGGRITRLIEFLPLPVRGAELLGAIASVDDSGPRLVANYEQRMPELYAAVDHFYEDEEPAETESLAWLLGAASLTIGLDQPDLDRALHPSLVGVKLDTVVIERDGRYLFDGRRFLRSLISYRIGDVPKDVLARSMFESLADFAVDAVRRLVTEWKADAIVCAGDLFAGNNILRVRTRGGLIALRLPLHFSPVARS